MIDDKYGSDMNCDGANVKANCFCVQTIIRLIAHLLCQLESQNLQTECLEKFSMLLSFRNLCVHHLHGLDISISVQQLNAIIENYL